MQIYCIYKKDRAGVLKVGEYIAHRKVLFLCNKTGGFAVENRVNTKYSPSMLMIGECFVMIILLFRLEKVFL